MVRFFRFFYLRRHTRFLPRTISFPVSTSWFCIIVFSFAAPKRERKKWFIRLETPFGRQYLFPLSSLLKRLADQFDDTTFFLFHSIQGVRGGKGPNHDPTSSGRDRTKSRASERVPLPEEVKPTTPSALLTFVNSFTVFLCSWFSVFAWMGFVFLLF